MKIPVSEPKFWGNEKKYVNDCLETNWISSNGKYINQFEEHMCSYNDRKYGVAVTNGTAAIEVAAYGIGIEPGDEVIIPSFTIISCANAIIRLGGVPVFIDIEDKTWNIDTTLIESAITSKTKAIMMVHIYGHPASYFEIKKIAEKYNLLIIEDAAEAQGSKINSKLCGSLGDVSTFSFYANKLITTGEGGMVLTDDYSTYNRMKSYKNLSFIDNDRFHHEELGFNYRMTNIQAAIGLGQIEKIEEIIHFKRKIGDLYKKKLSEIPNLRFHREHENSFLVYWMYCIQLTKNNLNAKIVMAQLEKEGIGCRPFFKGLHLQPALKNLAISKGSFKNTEDAYNYGFYLPSGMQMNEEKVNYVVSVLKKTLQKLSYI